MVYLGLFLLVNMIPTDFYFLVLPLGVLVFILASLVLYIARKEEKKEKKLKKLMRTYVRNRLKQEKIFTLELEKLEALLRDKSIDQDTYARLRQILDINFAQQREEARAQIQTRV